MDSTAEEWIGSVSKMDHRAYWDWYMTKLRHWASTDSDAQLAARPGINSPDEYGSSAIHWALHDNDNELLATLICRQAVVDISDHWGESPVHVAARSGSAEQLLLLREAGASVLAKVSNDAPPWAGGNALHLAAAEGNPETLTFLLDSKCNPMTTLSNGSTPLHCAIQHLDKEEKGYETTVKRFELCVKILLKECPESARVYDGYSRTPLQRAFAIVAPPEVRRALQKKCAPLGDKLGLITYSTVMEFDLDLKDIGDGYYEEERRSLIEDLRSQRIVVEDFGDDILIGLNYIQWWRWMIQSGTKSSL